MRTFKVRYGSLPRRVSPFRRTVTADTPLEAVKQTLEQLESSVFLRLFKMKSERRGDPPLVTASVYDARHVWGNGSPQVINVFTLTL